jgi:S1-C subfamily serine protease
MADLRRMRTVTGAALWALGVILCAPPPLHAQQTQPDRELAQARENAKWEQANAAKRLEAFLKDEPRPHPCQIFVEWSPRLYAIAAGTNAQQNGVRRGDRLKSINAEAVATLDDVTRNLTGVPAGTTAVTIVVERSLSTFSREGRDVPLRVQCQSDKARWEAKKKALEAMKDGRWNDCLLGMREVIQEWGVGRTGDVEVRGLCSYYDARLKGRPIGPDDAQSLYDWRHAQILEARYDPGALDRVRGDVLSSANVLRGWNAKNLAEDLELQLKEATLRSKVDPNDDSGHVQGTGVLARPDGTLLTAAHVVDKGKYIVVHCPGRKEAVAKTESIARNLDLAVIKTTLTNTAYLSLAPARSARMGEHLFTIGFPLSFYLGTDAKLTEGTLSALSGPGGETSLIQITVPIQLGNSGGPVVNGQGQIVGIVAAVINTLPFLIATGAAPQNVSWAVKSDYARPLFEQPTARPAAGSRTEALERARGATCRIEVDR